MVDLKRYHRLHPLGLCRVEKWDLGWVTLFKRFDNETGAELASEVNYVSIEEMEKAKEDLLARLSAVDSILEDMKKKS